MRINTIDFETLQNRIDAARHLQLASDTVNAERLLYDLAREILETFEPKEK